MESTATTRPPAIATWPSSSPSFCVRPENGLDYGLQSGLDMTNRTLASRDERWDRIADQAEGRAELDRRLFDEAREGERVVSIMEAIVTDRPLARAGGQRAQ